MNTGFDFLQSGRSLATVISVALAGFAAVAPDAPAASSGEPLQTPIERVRANVVPFANFDGLAVSSRHLHPEHSHDLPVFQKLDAAPEGPSQ